MSETGFLSSWGSLPLLALSLRRAHAARAVVRRRCTARRAGRLGAPLLRFTPVWGPNGTRRLVPLSGLPRHMPTGLGPCWWRLSSSWKQQRGGRWRPGFRRWRIHARGTILRFYYVTNLNNFLSITTRYMYRRTKFLKIARRKGRGAYEELDSCLLETLQWKIVTKNLKDPRGASQKLVCWVLSAPWPQNREDHNKKRKIVWCYGRWHPGTGDSSLLLVRFIKFSLAENVFLLVFPVGIH